MTERSDASMIENTSHSTLDAHLDEHGRPEPPLQADELATLLGFLDYQRATMAWKCRGLEAESLARRIAPSTMSLGGLLKHMTWVERYWFGHRLLGIAVGEPWSSVDWQANPDWDWESAIEDAPEDLRRSWADAVADSHKCVATAVAGGGLTQVAATAWPDGSAPHLRWILVHMIEEYARHNGHADLLRESIDGQRGE